MPAPHRAVSVLYRALLTGLVLTLVTRRDTDEAAEFVFRLFRRQHLERFRPGLAKLGLDGLPHAVACAQYHYLSNQLGGVKTESTSPIARRGSATPRRGGSGTGRRSVASRAG